MARRKNFEENNVLLMKDIKRGNIKARETFISYYIPVAEEIASEYFNLGIDDEDIISLSYEGLMEAVNLVENSHYVNMSTIIYRKIRRVIEENILLLYGIHVNLGTNLFSKIMDFLKTRRQLKEELGYNLSFNEISKFLGYSLEDVRNVFDRINHSEIEYTDMISLDSELLAEDVYFEKENFSDFKKLMEVILTKEELYILYLRNIKKLTLREVAPVLGYTHARVGQIEENIKEKLNNLRDIIINGDYDYIKWLQFKGKTLKEISVLSKSGNVDAFNYLFNYFKLSVDKIAGEYFDLGVDNQVILGYAYEGLSYSIKFDKNIEKFTILHRHVRDAVERGIFTHYNLSLKNLHVRKLDKSSKKMLFSILNAEKELETRLGYVPSVSEVSDYLDESVETIENVKKLIK